MSVSGTITYKLNTHDYKAGFFHLNTQSQATGDGTGGTVYIAVDWAGILTSKDYVWINHCSCYSDESVGSPGLTLETSNGYWTAFFGSPTAQTLLLKNKAMAAAAASATSVGYGAELMDGMPLYLGKPMSNSNMPLWLRNSTNTNGKIYKFFIQALVFRGY